MDYISNWCFNLSINHVRNLQNTEYMELTNSYALHVYFR
uniref:Uncharacterized protein n=1 Tax=Arundo donax TaxID=35708 RepID=A0A0A8YFX5_ARUDO